MLVHRAALGRHLGPERRQRLLQAGGAVDDQERRGAQAAGDQVFEHGPPGRLALSAHVAHRQQRLLTVAADAEHHQQRDRGRLAVQPHPHDGPVEDHADDVLASEVVPLPGLPVHLDLAPGPADHVLARRALEQRRQRPLHLPRVGARQIGPRDQCLQLARLPGVARQHRTAPLAGRTAITARLGRQPRLRNRDLQRPGAARQPPQPVAMAMARRTAVTPLVAAPPQRCLQLLLDQFLDQTADPHPNPHLQRVELGLPSGQRTLGTDLAAIFTHNVVSTGAPTPGMAR